MMQNIVYIFDVYIILYYGQDAIARQLYRHTFYESQRRNRAHLANEIYVVESAKDKMIHFVEFDGSPHINIYPIQNVTEKYNKVTKRTTKLPKTQIHSGLFYVCSGPK